MCQFNSTAAMGTSKGDDNCSVPDGETLHTLPQGGKEVQQLLCGAAP